MRNLTFLFVVLWFILKIHMFCSANGNVTRYPNFLERVLLRKRRFVVYPPGAGIIISFSMSKALELKYPRGINIVLECDFYYPLQMKIADWYPKKPDIQLPEDIDDSQMETDDNDNATKQPGDYNEIPVDQYDYIDRTPWNPHSDWHSVPDLNQLNVNPQRDFKHQSFSDKSPVYDPFRRQFRPAGYKDRSPINSYKRFKFKQNKNDIKRLPILEYHGHYARRDLYERFNGLSFKDGDLIKSCILRLICEVNYYLLPNGVSLFQDLLRLLFTTPKSYWINDDYGKAMRANKEDCDTAYTKLCPLSILGMLVTDLSKGHR